MVVIYFKKYVSYYIVYRESITVWLSTDSSMHLTIFVGVSLILTLIILYMFSAYNTVNQDIF